MRWGDSRQDAARAVRAQKRLDAKKARADARIAKRNHKARMRRVESARASGLTGAAISCTSKISYTQAEAARIAMTASCGLHAYSCCVCGGWHVSKKVDA